MKLTPLKITGKRRQKDEDEPVVVTPSKKATSKPKPRVQKSAEANASYLELMPLEILERIFWLSENVNLPRASPRVGVLLSGISTRQETFIVAFQPTWDACLGIMCPRRAFAPSWMANVPEIHKGNADFQSALLEFSWADIGFILTCWDRYIERRAKQQLLGSRASPTSRFHINHPSFENDVEAVGEGAVTGTSNDFWADYRLFRDLEIWEGDHRRVQAGPYLGLFTTSTFYQVNTNTRIPDKLLCSTKSESDIQKLFWLVRGGASLAPDQSWECTLEAFRNAFPEGIQERGQFSYAVLAILFILGAARSWPIHVFSDAIAALDDLAKNSQLGVLRRFRGHLSAVKFLQYPREV